MDMITHPNPIERWSIQRFLNEIADPEGDPIFEYVHRGESTKKIYKR